MTKKKIIIKIILILFIIILTVLAILSIPSAQMDIEILGDDYKYYLYDKYIDELGRTVRQSDLYYDGNKHSYEHYYDTEKFKFFIPAFSDNKDKDISCDGRKLYITVRGEYDGKDFEIRFQGTKIIANYYKWKMIPNELYPIDDSSLHLVYGFEYEAEYAEE